MSTRRALVTGITGQTGSYLAEQLRASGWEVHGIVRNGDPALLGEPSDSENHLHHGDLREHKRLAAIVDEVEPDALFHLGGLTSVGQSWEQPVEYAETTGVATAALLAAALQVQHRRNSPVAFVNASSAEIFGAAEQSPQNELTRIAPTSPYGAAKAFGHHLVGVYRGAGLQAANCILFNHESPRRPKTFVTRKITSGVADIAAGRAKFLTLGNTEARRDWGWAPDYADALARAATVGGDFVIATGIAHSVEDFVRAAFASIGVADWRGYVRQDERFMRPSDAPELLGDASRAREVLGWTPTVQFDEIVARMVRADLEG